MFKRFFTVSSAIVFTASFLLASVSQLFISSPTSAFSGTLPTTGAYDWTTVDGFQSYAESKGFGVGGNDDYVIYGYQSNPNLVYITWGKDMIFASNPTDVNQCLGTSGVLDTGNFMICDREVGGGTIRFNAFNGSFTDFSSDSGFYYASDLGFHSRVGVDISSVTITHGLVSLGDTDNPYPGAGSGLSTDVSYSLNIKISGSRTTFAGEYLSKVTDPVTSLPDPTQINWSVIQLNNPCLSGDTRTECTFASLGYVPVCPNVVLDANVPYNSSIECGDYTFDKDSTYALTAGFGYGLSTDFDTYPGYHIYFKTVTYVIPQDTASYTLLSSACSFTDGDGDYGLGRMCTGDAPIDCSSLGNFLAIITCNVNDATNFGLLNPSLLEFKHLLNSFVVTTPNCTLPLTNITIDGYTYPVEDLTAKICDTSHTLNETFPIASIVINFLLAFLVFTLIVRIFNRLTDNTKSDIIEGV